MAKRSQKHPMRHEKEQLGCMWGLISIFDFRHGRFTEKLLPDRHHGSSFAAGDGNAANKLGMLAWIDHNEGTIEGEEGKTAAANAVKPSVKKLLEEEMISEQNTKKEINNAEVEPKHSNREQGSHRKKTCKRMKKARKKSSDSITDLDAPENLKAEQTCHQNSEHQSTDSLDIDNVMDEFCHQIHQRSISYTKHEQPGNLDVQSNQKNPEFEEKLREAIKLLISQKLIKGKRLSEDREIHPSKEQLTDALQILGSDAELFVKYLQDPNSVLVKLIQNFLDGQLEKDEEFMSLAGSNLLEPGLGNLRQSDELVDHKQRKFFRRKVKSQERSPSNGEKTSQASNRIVILKPRITGSQNPETESTVGSSPESHLVIRNKESNERIGSHFFLSEIKRKLKYAMGKEHQANGIQKRLSYECQNLGDRDRGIKENAGMNSPTKDHFFVEKIARPVGVKKVGKTGELKDCELGTEHKSTDLPQQRVSNIYIEAKKHLSEMLSTGDENINSSSGQIPKTLGRILALPEYNFSPVGSPGRNWEDGFVTAQMRYFDSEKFHPVNQNTSSSKQNSHLGQTIKSLETEPCISDESSDNKVRAPTFNSGNPVEQIHDDEVNETSFSLGDEMSSRAGNVEIVKTNEIAGQEGSNVLHTLDQPSSSSSIKGAEQNEDESVIWNGQRHSKHLKEELDASDDNQLPASPLASPSNTLVTKKLEDQETAIDTLERPSPVSVLEPLFAEDEISPASTRSHIVDIPVQPLQIQFEEYASSAAVQSTQMKSSMEDKGSMFEYVKAVLQVSGLNWNELCVKSLSTDQLLDPSLFDEVEFLPNQLCYEAKLLFNLINEVLMEICGLYFGCLPWVSFIKPYIRPVPNEENALSEVWQGVLWHLIPLALPHSLELTVRKDMAKSGTWMDLRFDADSVGVEMGDAILEELIEDTLLSCVNESPDNECPLILAQMKESENNANSESFCPVPPAELMESESSI